MSPTTTDFRLSGDKTVVPMSRIVHNDLTKKSNLLTHLLTYLLS